MIERKRKKSYERVRSETPMKTFPLFLAIIASAPFTQAATLGYWRFESGALLENTASPGTHDLTLPGGTANPTQAAVSGAYPTTIPGNGLSNNSLATFDGGDRFSVPDNAAFTNSSFTVEAFVTATGSGTNTETIIGHWNSTGNLRSWLFGISASNVPIFLHSTTGGDTLTVTSSLPALALNVTYYMAVTVNMSDTSVNGITFYLKDMTNGGALTSAGATHAAGALFDTSTPLSIGATSQPSSGWTGSIDEVRLSNTKLAASDLLIVPEPSAALLSVLGVGMLAAKRRRPAA